MGLRAVLAMALCALQGTGCAIEDFSRKAGRGSVGGVLDELADKDNRQALRDAREAIFADVDVNKAARELAAATVAGTAEGLSKVDLEQRADRLVRAVLAAVRSEGGVTIT